MKKIVCRAFSCFVLVGSFAAIPALALDNGLAKTPPMGWNSWNKFACDVSEELIRSIADAMVTSGLKNGFVSILASKGGEKIQSSKSAAGERSYRIAK